MTCQHHLSALLGFALLLACPTLAWAGCTKDTDCKGARICIDAQCVDPPTTPTDPAASGVPDVDLRYARGRRGVAHRNLHGTWVLFGFEVASGISFGGWLLPLFFDGVDDESLGSFISLVPVTVFAGVTGPVASIGGLEARRGLERLGLEAVDTGLRTPGLALYGVSMGFVGGTYGALAALIGSDRDCFALDSSQWDACEQQERNTEIALSGLYAGLGLTAVTTGLISTALLQGDTAQQRRALLNAIDDAEAGRLGSARPRLRIRGVAPWFDVTPDRTIGGVALSGAF